MKRFVQFHPRSHHHGRYDFKKLLEVSPDLKPYISRKLVKDGSIDFSDPAAVKALNVALLRLFYGVQYWDIPEGYLCPPIPGRAEYIHQIADLIKNDVNHKNKVVCLDIGVGANCIYPIVAASQYEWHCIGSDIDPKSVASAQEIVRQNAFMQNRVEIRHQSNPDNIFAGIIKKNERIDVTICNPPFYGSLEELEAVTKRKNKNLHKDKTDELAKNFGGQSAELYCEGGELKFISKMIKQSKKYQNNCMWFTSLVSQEAHLKKFYKVLKGVETREIKTLPMNFGNKKSRILAWRF